MDRADTAAVTGSLTIISETVGSLSDALASVVRLQRRRFLMTMGGIGLAVAVVTIAAVLLLVGQARQRSDTEIRAGLNRDRQQCATSLLVEWDSALGGALRVSAQLPRVDPQSVEYREAIQRLNDATALIQRAPELCYGEHPNPDPIPR